MHLAEDRLIAAKNIHGNCCWLSIEQFPTDTGSSSTAQMTVIVSSFGDSNTEQAKSKVEGAVKPKCVLHQIWNYEIVIIHHTQVI